MDVIKLFFAWNLFFLIFIGNEGYQHRCHVQSITLWDFIILLWLRCSLDRINRFLLHNGVKMLVLLFSFIHDDVGLHLHEVLIVLVLILSNVIIIIVTVPVWLITNRLKIIIINTRPAILFSCHISKTYPSGQLIGEHSGLHAKGLGRLLYVDCSRSHWFQSLLRSRVAPMLNIIIFYIQHK